LEGARAYGVYHNRSKIGFAESTRIPTTGGGARFLDRAYWQFRAQGTVQRLAMESDTVVDGTWRLVSFKVRVDAGLARFGVQGTVGARSIEVAVDSGGQTFTQSLPIEGPVMAPGVLRAYVAARDPGPGEAFKLEVYNPLVRAVETMEVVVEERTSSGWRVSELARGSLRTTAWIDRQGATLREESALGFAMEEEPREKALAMEDDASALPDLVFAAAVPVEGDLSHPETMSTLQLKLQGITPSAFPALHGGRQGLVGDVVTVMVSPYPALSAYTLPFTPDAADAPPAELPGLRDALAADPLVQSGDADILATAQGILALERDPARAARKLHGWVHDNITKKSHAGVPSAVEVLKSRRGDCNEHTVLFTALARAVGLPTRMAAGVVHVASVGGGMYYHAWPEVWLGSWVALDPTLGQVPADATHVRFIVGGLDKQVDILRLVGSLRVEVVSVERTHGREPVAEVAP
jgi:transglutaminase-like putative cysteine protease